MAVVFLDIDNTLYPASTRIAQAMGERIHEYFVTMGLSHSDASELHHKYYKQYGLALRGLVRHHQIDPLDFDKKCDGSLPLETMIFPDPALRTLLSSFDRSKVRVWALTNAYEAHARRVLRILEIEDLIEGVIFCNYANPSFSCKPEPEYFHEALRTVNITDASKVYFVDDSLTNVQAAKQLGWGSCVWFNETGAEVVEGGKLVKRVDVEAKALGIDAAIGKLGELRTVWNDLFLPS